MVRAIGHGRPALTAITCLCALVGAPSVVAAQSGPAPAQEAAPAAPEDSTAAAEPFPIWSASASAGTSARDAGTDGSWQALALNRQIGRGYVRASAMHYSGTLTQADTALPSDYYIGTLAAGGNFDNWVGDAWGSYGQQLYGKITTSTGSRQSTGSKSSDYYAFGADFGRIFTLAPDLFLTPTIAASYAQGKLLRAAPSGSSKPDVETDEPTLTLSTTVRLDHAFGAHDNHYIGLLASRHWSSNGLSRVAIRASQADDGTTSFTIGSDHQPDGWFEFGATGSMQVTRRLYIDLYATRSFGMASGNTTSAGLTLRRSF